MIFYRYTGARRSEAGQIKKEEARGPCRDGEAHKGMEQNSVKKYSMEALRQTAGEVAPLLREMFGDSVEIDSMDDLQVNRETVVIYLQLPGSVALPAVDVRDLMGMGTVEEMADAAAASIQEGLRHLKDVRPESLEAITPAYVLAKVILETVNRERNAVMLEHCPHMEVLDLAGVYCVPLKMTRKGDDMCLLRRGNLETLGLTEEQIHAAAKKNTLRRLRVRVNRMDQMADQMARFRQSYGHALESADMDVDFWYVVDNWRHAEGAAYILIPEVLEALGEKMGRNYFISIPGTDLMMVYPDNGDPALPKLLAEWLRENLPDRQLLSDRLYYFDRRKGLQALKKF